jgi:hypothetical protein
MGPLSAGNRQRGQLIEACVAAVRDRTADDEITAESGELARHYLRSGGNLIAIIASAMALAFSGISLYETVIKQAHLHLFVPATAV